MRKKGKLFSGREDINFWPSFTDLLSSMLLFIILFLIAFLITKTETIMDQQREIDAVKGEMKKIIGMRTDIAGAIIQEFRDSDINIAVDKETGCVLFNSDILFDFDSARIKNEFKGELESFISIYFDAVLDPDYADNIAEIIVEGHTDDVGEYEYNLELSQERALNIVRYILDSGNFDASQMAEIRSKITANGRSYSQLKMDSMGCVDRCQSRRVEFKFRLKDEEMYRQFIKLDMQDM